MYYYVLYVLLYSHIFILYLVISIQAQYQHEIDKLEKENRELRRQILLQRQTSSNSTSGTREQRRGMRRTAIDMYSEVLDELSSYDNTSQDHLPRVVVVGDQSSGKVSD